MEPVVLPLGTQAGQLYLRRLQGVVAGVPAPQPGTALLF